MIGVLDVHRDGFVNMRVVNTVGADECRVIGGYHKIPL
jgi:hypothetical protein